MICDICGKESETQTCKACERKVILYFNQNIKYDELAWYRYNVKITSLDANKEACDNDELYDDSPEFLDTVDNTFIDEKENDKIVGYSLFYAINYCKEVIKNS